MILKCNARLDAGTNEELNIRFNGETSGTNYNSLQVAYNNASSSFKTITTAFATNKILSPYSINTSTVTVGSFSFVELHISNYASTSMSKVMTGTAGRHTSTSTDYRVVPRFFGSYISQNAITSVEFSTSANNFAIGSIFELYGAK